LACEDRLNPIWFKYNNRWVFLVEKDGKNFLFSLSDVRQASTRYKRYSGEKQFEEMFYEKQEADRYKWYWIRKTKGKPRWY